MTELQSPVEADSCYFKTKCHSDMYSYSWTGHLLLLGREIFLHPASAFEVIKSVWPNYVSGGCLSALSQLNRLVNPPSHQNLTVRNETKSVKIETIRRHLAKLLFQNETKLGIKHPYNCVVQNNYPFWVFHFRHILFSVQSKIFVSLRKQFRHRFMDPLFHTKQSDCFAWNYPVVSIKTIRLFPKWDERCFAYCFVLRRLIFSVFIWASGIFNAHEIDIVIFSAKSLKYCMGTTAL